MHRPTEGRHLADKQTAASTARIKHFMKLSRKPRQTFAVSRPASTKRLAQFLRIERGELA